ncbi:serine hydrolase domain-containing protein [Rhodococcus sp. NPDC059234]|uniref:serine hydrolase domain-containing protein n=1 Tax=Rhodococcus sp. NPDC059234 TaxID=3346781 RepID=UPI0036708865
MRTVVLVIGAALLLVSGCSASSTPVVVSAFPDRTSVQGDLDGLTRQIVGGAIASLAKDDHALELRSGVGDRTTREAIPEGAQVRIGSVTKTFMATIVLQLVDEGKVDLDAPVDRYLPGVIAAEGVDPKAITVRQVLQHTSGLPEYADDPRIEQTYFGSGERFTPPDLLAMATRKPAKFAPGARMEYTNTNYLVAGMLIERVTGNRVEQELARRITDPLELTDTYLPGPGEAEIRGRHPHGYERDGDRVLDVTRSEPSGPWTAGAMVSSGADLGTFLRALVQGRLVSPAAWTAMSTTVPMSEPGMSYGLGLMSARLSCGKDYWGHSGDIAGFHTVAGATADGRAVTITVTQAPPQPVDTLALLSHALC